MSRAALLASAVPTPPRDPAAELERLIFGPIGGAMAASSAPASSSPLTIEKMRRALRMLEQADRAWPERQRQFEDWVDRRLERIAAGLSPEEPLPLWPGGHRVWINEAGEIGTEVFKSLYREPWPVWWL